MPSLTIQARKVIVSRQAVASFNRGWPCSTLRDRSYWFDFAPDGSLVDTDVPESDDGGAPLAMAQDCQDFLENGTRPEWAPE